MKKLIIICVISVIIIPLIFISFAHGLEPTLDNSWMPGADEQITSSFTQQARAVVLKRLDEKNVKNRNKFLFYAQNPSQALADYPFPENATFWQFTPGTGEWDAFVSYCLFKNQNLSDAVKVAIDVEKELLTSTRKIFDFEEKWYYREPKFANKLPNHDRTIAAQQDFIRTVFPIPFKGSALETPTSLFAYLFVKKEDKSKLSPEVRSWLYSQNPKIIGGMGFILLPNGILSAYTGNIDLPEFTDDEIQTLSTYAAADWLVALTEFFGLAKIYSAGIKYTEPFSQAEITTVNKMNKLLKKYQRGLTEVSTNELKAAINKGKTIKAYDAYEEEVASRIRSIKEGKNLNDIFKDYNIKPYESEYFSPIEEINISELSQNNVLFNKELSIFYGDSTVKSCIKPIEKYPIHDPVNPGATYQLGSNANIKSMISRIKLVESKIPDGSINSKGQMMFSDQYTYNNDWGGSGGIKELIIEKRLIDRLKNGDFYKDMDGLYYSPTLEVRQVLYEILFEDIYTIATGEITSTLSPMTKALIKSNATKMAVKKIDYLGPISDTLPNYIADPDLVPYKRIIDRFVKNEFVIEQKVNKSITEADIAYRFNEAEFTPKGEKRPFKNIKEAIDAQSKKLKYRDYEKTWLDIFNEADLAEMERIDKMNILNKVDVKNAYVQKDGFLYGKINKLMEIGNETYIGEMTKSTGYEKVEKIFEKIGREINE